MKKQYIRASMTFFILLFMPCLWAHVIVISYDLYPGIPNEKKLQRFVENLKYPHKISRYMLRNLEAGSLVEGIFATYMGYVETSDSSGITVFPRKDSAPEVSIIITPRIVPITIGGNTIHHWRLNQDSLAQGYRYQYKKDQDTALYFWEVTPIKECWNADIPINAVVIFAHPKHIFVPLGIIPTQPSPNLILPPLFIKKRINTLSRGLFVVNISQYFRNLAFLSKKEDHAFSLRATF